MDSKFCLDPWKGPYTITNVNGNGTVMLFFGNKHIVGTKQHDPKRLAPNFAFVPEERILKTIDHTTQHARVDTRLPLRKHFKSRFPVANVVA
jgi:hypothetical protein